MPIAQINPNGTVKIFNKNTGEVRDVAPEELQNYNPALIGEYQAKLQEQQNVTSAAKAIQEGKVRIGDIPAEQRLTVASEIDKAGGVIPGTPSAADKKKKDSMTAVTNFINNLEKHYQAAGGAEVDVPIISRIMGMGKTVSGKLGFNQDATLYNNEKEGFTGTLKSLAGESGPLTKDDWARLAKLLPGLGAQSREAKGAFNDLRSQIAAAYGGPATETTIRPEAKGLGEVMVGNAKNVINDIVAGATANATAGTRRQAANQNFQTAGELEQQAQQEADPTRKKALLQAAQGLYLDTSKQAGDVSQTFSKQVTDNPIIRGLLAGNEVVGAAGLPGMAKSGVNLIRDPGKVTSLPKAAVGKVFTQDKGSAIRNQAIASADEAGKAISGEPLAQSLVEWGENALKANPGKEKQIQKIVDSSIDTFSGKQFKASDLKKIWDEVDSGFNQSGVTKTSVEASSDRAIRDALRRALEEAAPGFEEGTKLIRKGLGRKKFAEKALFPAAIGTGVSIPVGIAINKALGQR